MSSVWKPRTLVVIAYQHYVLPRLRLLVDSGADITVITRSDGNLLGLTIEPGEAPMYLRGFSGHVVAGYRRDVTVTIQGHSFPAPVFWAASDEVHRVLGREGVFDRFDVDIRQADRQILLWWREDRAYKVWKAVQRVLFARPFA
jgi:hypothetical protein